MRPNKLFGRFQAAAALIVPLVLSFTFTVVSPVAAAADGPPQDYVIKLSSANPAVLQTVGTDVIKRFTAAASPEFKNIYTFQSTLPVAALRADLAGTYDYLEPETSVQADAGLFLNDPGFTTDVSDIDRQWGLPRARFTNAWSKTTGSTAVKVAIIDTGIDQIHEDLRAAAFASGFDFLQNVPINTGTDSDDNGHGTLVTGVIAATPNNGLGIAGAAPQVTIMPLKALDAQGSGNSVNISQAIVWAADHGADIISMSLAGIGFAHDTTLSDAISYAYGKGALLVSAAGNDVATTGGNLDQEAVFPVCDDNGDNMVLGVAALDQNDQKPEFSNYGKNCIDVSAPGKRILSTINHDPVTKAPVANGYAYASGTSLAVPFVAAEAVLIKAQSPQATNKQIRDRIIATADPVDNLNPVQCGGGSCAGLLGAGRINAERAVAEIIKQPTIQEGDVVGLPNGSIYYITGGKRHLVTPFVKNQRFPNVVVKIVQQSDLANFPEGSYAEPFDGTLIKSNTSPTVYFMSKGFRLPVTGQIFQLRGLKFSDVAVLTDTEVNAWLAGSFLPPPDGTVLKSQKNPTVYWVIGSTLHPVNLGFYLDRGLNVFPIVVVSDNDLASFSRGEAYIR